MAHPLPNDPPRLAARATARTRATCVVVVVALCGLAACPSGDSTSDAGPSPPDAAAPPPPQAPDGGPVPGLPTCPPDTLCLSHERLAAGPIPEGRLVVVWAQLNDDLAAPPPAVAYDVAFDPSFRRTDIPLTALAPPDDPYLMCERDCLSTLDCPCISALRVGLGLVAVIPDLDGDGVISAYDITADPVPIGIGRVVLVYSEERVVDVPVGYGRVLGEGVPAGITIHRIVDGHPFDMLEPAAPGEVFPLFLCAQGQACELPYPNLG